MKNRGTAKASTIFIAIIFLYIIFGIVQFVLAYFNKVNLKSAIVELIGSSRGEKMNPADIEQKIIDLIKSKGVIFDEEKHAVTIQVDQKGILQYYYEFDEQINLLFFKTKPKLITESGEMDSYGL